MQPVIGTMNPERLQEICQASELYLTREEWYQIYISAGNQLP
jgi:predicted oxidoreductase